MKPVIEVHGISKSYRISHQAENKAGYNTLKDDFAKLVKKPFGGTSDESFENFWALRDVSFEVNHGEVFGIIGQNGSGKSTLLKILSRIVDPTKGEATIHGRTASLLEVGTGFHPELTGRENIYFNGSMLGMSRQEIQRKFDEIVEFSEVEKFLDTPVKFYSSGMYVRLAFSVAAHLDSDILILDEVLAVGDAAFQQKSLNKVLSSMREGRTVLFVSHSMDAINKLCSRGILLKNGRIVFSGPSDKLSEHYIKSLVSEKNPKKLTSKWVNNGSLKTDYFDPSRIYITDRNGKPCEGQLSYDKEYWLCIEGTVKTDTELFDVGYVLRPEDSRAILYLTLNSHGKDEDNWPTVKKGKALFRGLIPKGVLNGGKYKASLISSIHTKSWIFSPEDLDSPSVEFIVKKPTVFAGYTSPKIVWHSDYE